ncbi:MAG: hypothetical protein WAM11_09245 [Cyanobium sp.]
MPGSSHNGGVLIGSTAMPFCRKLIVMLAATGGLIGGLVSGSVCAQSMGQGAQKAMFNTKAEAEAAAKHFNCKGAHKMGNHWMPCASHGEASGGMSGPASH